MSYLVVKLDNAKYGAGPGTVVGIVETHEEYNAFVTDRDGARDPAMRCWVDDATTPIAVGDRVVMRQLGTGKTS